MDEFGCEDADKSIMDSGNYRKLIVQMYGISRDWGQWRWKVTSQENLLCHRKMTMIW